MSSRSSHAKEAEKKVLLKFLKNIVDAEDCEDAEPPKYKDNAELMRAYKEHVASCRVRPQSSSKKLAEPEETLFGVSIFTIYS